MSYVLSGYLRSAPGGTGIAGDTVNLLDVNTGIAPAVLSYTNLSPVGGTTTTDADGKWEFTIDLLTGPLFVEAVLGGGDFRYRYNDEMFIYDGSGISALPYALSALTDGVVFGSGALSSMAAAPTGTRTIDVLGGVAIIKGYALGWSEDVGTGIKQVSGSANGSVGTTRHDYVVLRQYYQGSEKGRQDILLIEGSPSTDPVVTDVEADLTQFIRGANIWDVPIHRGKLANGSSTYVVEDLRGTSDYPWSNRINYFDHDITFEADIIAQDDIFVSGGIEVDNEVKFTNSYGLRFEGTSPTLSYGAGAGTGGSRSNGIEGTDMAGKVTLTTGATSVSSGILIRVNFFQARDDTFYSVSLTPADGDGADVNAYVNAADRNVNYFEISCRDTPAINTSHHWFYRVDPYQP